MNNASIWVLLASVGMLCLGHGLNGSLVSLSADQAEFSTSTTGFVMNMSELPDFDQQFPGHPLTMARELLRSIAEL